MSALDEWRALLRPLISRGFLRRDQGAGLLISDYPRHGDEKSVEEKIGAAGFSVSVSNGLALIDALPERYNALLSGLAEEAPFVPPEELRYLYALSMHLQKEHTPSAMQPLAPVRFVLKALEAGDFDALNEKLPPIIALLQRQHQPLPSGAGTLILRAIREKGEKEC